MEATGKERSFHQPAVLWNLFLNWPLPFLPSWVNSGKIFCQGEGGRSGGAWAKGGDHFSLGNSLGFRGEAEIGFLQYLVYLPTPKRTHIFSMGFASLITSIFRAQVIIAIPGISGFQYYSIPYVPIALPGRNQLKGASPPHKTLFIAAYPVWRGLLQ